jgi:hypothetical protein
VADVMVAPAGMPVCALADGVDENIPIPSIATIRPLMMVEDIFFMMISLLYYSQCFNKLITIDSRWRALKIIYCTFLDASAGWHCSMTKALARLKDFLTGNYSFF